MSVIRIFPGGQAGAPTRDDRFVPVVEWVRTGNQLGQPFLVPLRFTENLEECEDIRRSLYNAARYYCSCGSRNCCRRYGNLPHEANELGGCPAGGQRISCQAKVVKHDGRNRVQFIFFDKREALREMIVKYGPFPSGGTDANGKTWPPWPYQSKARKIREG